MQTLGPLRFDYSVGPGQLAYRLDEYLARIVGAINDNALDREIAWTLDNPVNGTYPIWIPKSARRIVGVGFVLQAGTCTATVTHGSNTVSWTGAGGTGLSVTTTDQTDTAASSNDLAADVAVKVVISGVSGAAGLAVSLRMGA